MHASRRQIATTILVVMVILATVSLAKATRDYVGFYEAITNFNLQLRGVDFVADKEALNLMIKLSVFNPTSYGNLQLKGIVGDIYYVGELHNVTISYGGPRSGTPYLVIETKLWKLPPAETNLNRVINPYSSMHVSMNLNATDDSAKTFFEYFEKQGGREEEIHWQMNLRIVLEAPTYLERISLEYQFEL